MQPVGLESKLAGICLCLTFLFVVVLSEAGVFSAINPYWLRVSVIEAVTLVPTLVFLYMGKDQYVPMLRIKPAKIRVILMAVLVEICITPLIGLANMITTLFTPNVAEAAIDVKSVDTPYGMMVIAMAVCPAIFEELASRGILLSAFNRSGRKGAAIIYTALCFALFHGNFNQMCYAFIVGVATCVVVEASDSILTSVCMHFFTNFFSITFMYYMKYIDVAEMQTQELFGSSLGTAVDPQIPEEYLEAITTAGTIVGIILVVVLAFFGLVAAYRLVGSIAKASGRYEYMKSVIPQVWVFRFKSVSRERLEERIRRAEMAKKTEGDATSVPADGTVNTTVPADGPVNTTVPADGAVNTTVPADILADMPKRKIMNPFLALGIVLWIAYAILYELAVHGVFNKL